MLIHWGVTGTLLKATVLGQGPSSWSAVSGAPNTPSGGTYTNTPGATPTYYRLQQR